jgi:hypothetical protein
MDVSSGTDFSYMFQNCFALTEIPEMNTQNGTNFKNMFEGCSALETIHGINVETATTTYLSNMFQNCSKLKDVTFIGLIPWSVSFANSPDLSISSKENIFNALKTTETSQTLTFHANTKILQSQVDGANAKGWTVAGGTVVSEEEYYG